LVGRAALPQWVELDFGHSVAFNTVHVTFQHSKLAAKAYRIEAWIDDKWQSVSTEASHDARFRRSVHGLPTVNARKFRVVIAENAAAATPVLREIRAYQEP
jgi:hypothetical protein